MSEIFEKLRAPFPPDAVSWRVGSVGERDGKKFGKALAYIDARDVMRRLDDVLGPANWQNDYLPMSNGTTCCRIDLKIDGEWVGKANGAGATDYEAEKGAYSDAFKRAAVLWGIGQYLYDLDAPWVEVEQRGKSAFIKKDELPKLRGLLERNGAPPKSAYAARKEGEYPRLEAGIHECRTLDDLARFWKKEAKVIGALPDSWQRQLVEEKNRIKGELQEAEGAL